ncbi:MAG: hypothetical protein ACLRSW_13450 [Christensenellaceae bacterium]
MLLDKTATLTVGRPQVTDFEPLTGDESFLLGLAASIEAHSNHPIAECVRAYAEAKAPDQNLRTENYAYEMGKGATADYEGKNYRLGNRKLLGAALKKVLRTENAYSAEGKTVAFLADDKHILAILPGGYVERPRKRKGAQGVKWASPCSRATAKTPPRRFGEGRAGRILPRPA